MLTIEDCLRVYGAPEIIKSDQSVQYTTKNTASIDGRRHCKDNIWIESFWRTIKQKYINLNPTGNIEKLQNGISEFIKFYNHQRPHQSLESCCTAWNKVFLYKKEDKIFYCLNLLFIFVPNKTNTFSSNKVGARQGPD